MATTIPMMMSSSGSSMSLIDTPTGGAETAHERVSPPDDQYRDPRRRWDTGRHQLSPRDRLVPGVPAARPDPAGLADPPSHRHGWRPAGRRTRRRRGRGAIG